MSNCSILQNEVTDILRRPNYFSDFSHTPFQWQTCKFYSPNPAATQDVCFIVTSPQPLKLSFHHLPCLFMLFHLSVSLSLSYMLCVAEPLYDKSSPPACFIGSSKSLQRCPKQILRIDMWLHGGKQGGGGWQGEWVGVLLQFHSLQASYSKIPALEMSDTLTLCLSGSLCRGTFPIPFSCSSRCL